MMDENVRVGTESERATLLFLPAFLGLAPRTHAGRALGLNSGSLNAGGDLRLIASRTLGPGHKAQEGKVLTAARVTL
jgi:hypothetical protein